MGSQSKQGQSVRTFSWSSMGTASSQGTIVRGSHNPGTSEQPRKWHGGEHPCVVRGVPI